MTRDPVTPDDLRKSATQTRAAMEAIKADEWDEAPPRMTWTRKVTGMHTVNALHFYATQLASGSRERVATFDIDEANTRSERIPALISSSAAILARVAEASPAGSRAFHSAGSPDPEGFLAMGCTEVLLHCWDAVNGMDAGFTGDGGISDRILRRLFPWSPVDTPRWQTLLFATGRGELPGHESPGDRWGWHNRPLDEWDGNEVKTDLWAGRR